MMHVADILSTVGMFSTVGDILSTVRGVQCSGGYHCGGYHDAREGYHEYCGGGGERNLFLLEYPHGTEHHPRYS